MLSRIPATSPWMRRGRRARGGAYLTAEEKTSFKGYLVDYSLGRSNGCTSWSPSDARQIIPVMKSSPTTLYIYPESKDIDAVAAAIKAGQSSGTYWNASCLKEIRSLKFWPRETLEPLLIQYRKDHPDGPPQPLPICKGS